MTTTKKNSSAGFTLIELLLAMSFIAFLLLFMVAGILQVTKLYVKGSAIRQINQTGRQLMGDLGSTLRNNTNPLYVAANNRLCVGDTSYVWNIEGQTGNKFDDGSVVGFISTQDPGGTLCNFPTNAVPKSGSVDLIGADITALKFSVAQEGRLWSISLALSTAGSNIAVADSTSPTGFSCSSSNQFCALGDFETSVYSRGGQ